MTLTLTVPLTVPLSLPLTLHQAAPASSWLSTSSSLGTYFW